MAIMLENLKYSEEPAYFVSLLKSYAEDNYEKGGHWVVECFDNCDYKNFLDEANGNLSVAKKELKKYWKLMAEQESNCAW